MHHQSIPWDEIDAQGLPSVRVPSGFAVRLPAEAQLPPVRADVPIDRRCRAAMLVVAIGRMYPPEEVLLGVPIDVAEAFSDPLDLGEALVFVDLLLEALVPLEVGA